MPTPNGGGATATEMARAFVTYLVRPPETMAALFGAPGAVFSRWDAMTRSAHVIAIGGNDAHARLGTVEDTDTIVGGMAVHLPSYEAAFKSLSVSAVLEHSLSGKATGRCGDGARRRPPRPRVHDH